MISLSSLSRNVGYLGLSWGTVPASTSAWSGWEVIVGIALRSGDGHRPLSCGQVRIALEILSPGPGPHQRIREKQRIKLRMPFHVDAQHLPDLTLVPVGIPVQGYQRWNRWIIPRRLDLEHGHDLMGSVAGHDLYNFHLISGHPVNACAAGVMIKIELGREVFADIQDLLGVNGGPKPPVRFHSGVQYGSRKCGLDGA